jgi:hypothetical protein
LTHPRICIYNLYIANTNVNNTFLHIADKNNTTTTLIFIGLNKAVQVSNIKTSTKIRNSSNLEITKIINIYYTLQRKWTPQKDSARKKSDVLKQMYFNESTTKMQ